MKGFDLQSGVVTERASGILKKVLAALTALPPFARVLFLVALATFIYATFTIGNRFIDRYLVEVPRHGGQLVEGLIGRPRFINPVIAKSDADRDMVQLVYSGLLKATPEGMLLPDIAEDLIVSDDGLTYTFMLREGLLWHDGEPITSADIAFTIEKVRDPGLAIKSPYRASWEGVDVSTPDDQTVIFKIKQPYAPFLENATMGIIPKHIWEKVPDEEFDVSYFNIEPIGSGPYRFATIVRDSSEGLPRYYDLVAFKRYALGEPYVTDLRMQFFGNIKDLAQALREGTIDQMHNIAPDEAVQMEQSGVRIVRISLPRIFAAFFNQNQRPIFADQAVRNALSVAVDKEDIVGKVLLGYGKAINGPLPSLEPSEDATTTPDQNATSTDRTERARAILEQGGWQLNAANVYEKTDKKKKTVTLLEFSISVPDVPELKNAVELMKKDWEKIGAAVTVKIFDPSTFTTDVLAPRKYDVLFYGEIVGRVPDPYAYWHSSQRNSPGLNVALYANKDVDKILESARKESDTIKRDALFEKFNAEIMKDKPAIFVYSPDFLYATSKKVYGIDPGFITMESERFLGITRWYIDSERVWKWFAR